MSLNLGKAIKLLKHYHDHLNQPEVSRAYQAIIPKATWDDQTKDPQQRYFQKLFRIGSHQVDLFFLTPRFSKNGPNSIKSALSIP